MLQTTYTGVGHDAARRYYLSNAFGITSFRSLKCAILTVTFLCFPETLGFPRSSLDNEDDKLMKRGHLGSQFGVRIAQRGRSKTVVI